MSEHVDWRAWRLAQRHSLLAARGVLSPRDRHALDTRLLAHLHDTLPPLDGFVLGLYWPVRGEPDLRSLAAVEGVVAALPRVVRRDAPVEFLAWTPGEPMREAGFGVMLPVERRPVRPELLLVPLLGFDAAGFRLGYGSGFYDRTLAAARSATDAGSTPPLAIGVGYELGPLPSIHPQPHDQAMDLLLTEQGVQRPPRRTTVREETRHA